MIATSHFLRCLVPLLVAVLVSPIAAAKSTKNQNKREQFYFGVAGGIGHTPYNLRLGWRYDKFTLAELGTGVWGPWVEAFESPIVFMQAIHIGSTRLEWGASYHNGTRKRSIAYSRTKETLTAEERSRFGNEETCDNSACDDSPVVLEREVNFRMLYTHVGIGWDREINAFSRKVKASLTLGYTHLAYSRIDVKAEPGDEILGKHRGIQIRGIFSDTIVGEDKNTNSLYLQVGMDWPLDFNRDGDSSKSSLSKPQSASDKTKFPPSENQDASEEPDVSPNEAETEKNESADARVGKTFAASWLLIGDTKIGSPSGILLTHCVNPQMQLSIAFLKGKQQGPTIARNILLSDSADDISWASINYQSGGFEVRRFIGNSMNIALEVGAASILFDYQTANDNASGQAKGHYQYATAAVGNAWTWDRGFTFGVDWLRLNQPFGGASNEKYAHPDAKTDAEQKFHKKALAPLKETNIEIFRMRFGWMF